MGAKLTDICGVIDVRGSTEFICVRRPHVNLRLVRPDESAKNIKFTPNSHFFKRRYPYRTKEQ